MNPNLRTHKKSTILRFTLFVIAVVIAAIFMITFRGRIVVVQKVLLLFLAQWLEQFFAVTLGGSGATGVGTGIPTTSSSGGTGNAAGNARKMSLASDDPRGSPLVFGEGVNFA